MKYDVRNFHQATGRKHVVNVNIFYILILYIIIPVTSVYDEIVGKLYNMVLSGHNSLSLWNSFPDGVHLWNGLYMLKENALNSCSAPGNGATNI